MAVHLTHWWYSNQLTVSCVARTDFQPNPTKHRNAAVSCFVLLSSLAAIYQYAPSPSLPKYGHFIPARDGADQVLGVIDTSRVKSNGTGPARRQLRDKAGGVAPASLSPDLAAL
jgi:hypothetical protein